jgi:hypothetical protein
LESTLVPDLHFMSKPEQNSKVTLEDLLRLKRAERPSPDFWLNFERELRQKQLTALVQKRRWWHNLPILFNRRISVPAGAAAIIAFTIITSRYSVPHRTAHIANLSPRVVAAVSPITVLPPTEGSQPAQNQGNAHEKVAAHASDGVADVMLAGAVIAATPSNSLTRENQSSSAQPLVASLSRLDQSEFDLVESALGSRLSAPVRVEPAAGSQSEVTAMTPASPGRYQLIARYAERSLSPAPAAPAVVRERLARRLGDDLGDSISRIGVVGSRVSLKF